MATRRTSARAADALGGVGSRFRGNDAAPGNKRDGAQRAPSWRYRAAWIPAYAGMTARVGSRLRGQGAV